MSQIPTQILFFNSIDISAVDLYRKSPKTPNGAIS
jgi:hypothetical protein